MNARFAPLFLALVLTGCPETTLVCDVGEVRNGDGICVDDPRDSGVVQLDGGRDASTEDGGTDAGVTCDPACQGDTYCAELGGGDPACIECRNSDECGGGVCVNNDCVQCEDSGDCDEATPICDSGTCRECVSAGGECADRDATTPACGASGRCVQCTAQDESACTEGVCDVLAETCTSFAPGDAALCDPCVNDRHCGVGQLCVPQRFGTPPALVSHVCAWPITATGVGAPNGACSNVPPYVANRSITSLGGGGVEPATVEVCLLETSTCEAHRDFRAQSCMSGATLSGPVADTTCGADGHDDGFCARRDAAANLCTVECSALADCPCSGGTCASRYECASGFCSLSRTCLVATPTTCTP